MLLMYKLVINGLLLSFSLLNESAIKQEKKADTVTLATDRKDVRAWVHLPSLILEIEGKAKFTVKKMQYDDSFSGYLDYEIAPSSLAKISAATNIPLSQLTNIVRFDKMVALPVKDTSCTNFEVEFDTKYYSTEMRYLQTKMVFPKFSLILQS